MGIYPSDVAAVLQIVYLFSHAVLLTSELKAKVCNSVGDMWVAFFILQSRT